MHGDRVSGLGKMLIEIDACHRSKTGLVNVYGSEGTMTDMSTVPRPLKTIGNLTTSISTLRFNHDAQILAIASKSKKDQLKMVILSICHYFHSVLMTTADRYIFLP